MSTFHRACRPLKCSSLRHALFQSGAFDLGIYDQVVYLISQGQPPISSFLGFHHLGNHAAWAVYVLSLRGVMRKAPVF